jgi:hypothetical protein
MKNHVPAPLNPPGPLGMRSIEKLRSLCRGDQVLKRILHRPKEPRHAILQCLFQSRTREGARSIPEAKDVAAGRLPKTKVGSAG